jgi:hypothetical protein
MGAVINSDPFFYTSEKPLLPGFLSTEQFFFYLRFLLNTHKNTEPKRIFLNRFGPG